MKPLLDCNRSCAFTTTWKYNYVLLNISWGTLSLVSSSYLVTASSYNFVTSHCDSLFVLKSLSDVLNYACTLVHSLGIYKLGKTFKMKICSFNLSP